MCIMAEPVVSVTNTRIFAGSNLNGRQALVYAMSVQLSNRVGRGNAMILPVPVGVEGAGSIELIDLSLLPDFFMPLDELFRPRSRSMSKGMSLGMDDDLEVHKVGKYDVSIVPTVDDVKRLNSSVFEVSADTEHTLREHYPVGFAFVVSQLRESGDFHPLAYTHPLVGERLFIPTRHEHGKGASDRSPKWDHTIYYQGGELDVVPAEQRNMASRQTIDATRYMSDFSADVGDKVPALAPYIVSRGITRVKAQGRLPNIDLTVRA